MAHREDDKTEILDELLADAIGRRYCPICAILEEKTRDLLCRLQYDAVNREEVNTSVVSAGGYCNFHFWYLVKLASPVTNARLLENLFKRIRDKFSDYQNAAPSAPDRFSPSIRCPVCCSSRIWEEELLALFVAKIAQADFQAAYQRSRGVCLPHLAQILGLAKDGEAEAFLVDATGRQLDVLIQELRLQVTKWRDKDRRPGEEKDSTYRAIEKLVGGRNCRIG